MVCVNLFHLSHLYRKFEFSRLSSALTPTRLTREESKNEGEITLLTSGLFARESAALTIAEVLFNSLMAVAKVKSEIKGGTTCLQVLTLVESFVAVYSALDIVGMSRQEVVRADVTLRHTSQTALNWKKGFFWW